MPRSTGYEKALEFVVIVLDWFECVELVMETKMYVSLKTDWVVAPIFYYNNSGLTFTVLAQIEAN